MQSPVDNAAIAVALACGEMSDLVELLPVQQHCGVDPHLAHLASLLCVGSPPYTVEQENEFARLQLCYHKAAGSDRPRLYKLSPLIAPPQPRPQEAEQPPNAAVKKKATKAQAANKAEMEAAADRARKAEAQLLALLQHEQQQLGAKAMAKKKKREEARAATAAHSAAPAAATAVAAAATAVAAANAPQEFARASRDGATSSSATLEELSAARGTPIDLASFDASEWTEVKREERSREHKRPEEVRLGERRKAQPTAPPLVSPREATERSSQRREVGSGRAPKSPPKAISNTSPRRTAAREEAAVEVAAAEVEEAAAEARAAGMQVLVASRVKAVAAAAAAPVLPTMPTATQAPAQATQAAAETQVAATQAVPAAAAPAAATATATPAATAVIELEKSDEESELRRQVAELRAAMEAKDAAHARELAAAQEREGMRLQALRLRLYIATSRVSVLEDALAQHVAAVGGVGPPVAMGLAEQSEESEEYSPTHRGRAGGKPLYSESSYSDA